jgi:hypothetical protein
MVRRERDMKVLVDALNVLVKESGYPKLYKRTERPDAVYYIVRATWRVASV